MAPFRGRARGGGRGGGGISSTNFVLATHVLPFFGAGLATSGGSGSTEKTSRSPPKSNMSAKSSSPDSAAKTELGSVRFLPPLGSFGLGLAAAAAREVVALPFRGVFWRKASWRQTKRVSEKSLAASGPSQEIVKTHRHRLALAKEVLGSSTGLRRGGRAISPEPEASKGEK